MNKKELFEAVIELPVDYSGSRPKIDKLTTLELIKLLDEPQKKEKRYMVKMKGLSECYNYLNYDSLDDEWYFTDAENGSAVGTHHTRKKFEDAGFGEVFNSPLFEVEEVEE